MLWLPVVLIYFMDLQIWYSIISAVVGGTIGLFSHLGEIRNISQLRLRFQFFASAMQFNLMPEEKLLSQQATLLRKLRDAIHRLKLRYGLGKPFTKIESSQVDATRFALIWNEIIITFREEDILSDRELELLELPPNCWKIRAKELENESDTSLWLRICKSEYRRCAVIEAYDSIEYLFLMTLKVDKVEFSIVTNIFREIDYYIQESKLKYYATSGIGDNNELIPDSYLTSAVFVNEHIEVRPDHIAAVAPLRSGIPVQQLTADESSLLLDLDNKLREQVIGQEEAVSAISRAMKRCRVGLKDPSRLIATLLFCGPTGVGKTELAKSLAACYFGSERNMIRLDMSEYMERHSVSKLIGSSPGYVGYGEGAFGLPCLT
ncbi:hypothetical protein RYX36_025995 [Vicia faba]